MEAQMFHSISSGTCYHGKCIILSAVDFMCSSHVTAIFWASAIQLGSFFPHHTSSYSSHTAVIRIQMEKGSLPVAALQCNLPRHL